MIRYWFRLANQSLVFFMLSMAVLAEDDATRSFDRGEKETFVQRAQEGDIVAVQILGKTKDASLIPILARQLNDARRSKASPVYIRSLRKSLASLGNPDSRKEIIEEIESKDRYVQYHAFEDAGEVGGNDMVIKLAEKLFDPSPGGRPIEQGGVPVEDVSLPAPRHAAVIALSRIIDDPTAPRIDLKRITYNEENVQKWRVWWNANKKRFVKGSPIRGSGQTQKVPLSRF